MKLISAMTDGGSLYSVPEVLFRRMLIDKYGKGGYRLSRNGDISVKIPNQGWQIYGHWWRPADIIIRDLNG